MVADSDPLHAYQAQWIAGFQVIPNRRNHLRQMTVEYIYRAVPETLIKLLDYQVAVKVGLETVDRLRVIPGNDDHPCPRCQDRRTRRVSVIHAMVQVIPSSPCGAIGEIATRVALARSTFSNWGRQPEVGRRR